MDDDNATPIANRDEAIPVLRAPTLETDNETVTSASDSEVSRSTREKLGDTANAVRAKLGYDESASPLRFHDRVFAGIMAQIIPPGELGENAPVTGAAPKVKDRRSRKYVERPSFNLGIMSANFRRFNARIGIVFAFQNRLIHLFSWKAPTETLSFLACYTLLCLQPQLLPLVPLVLALFFIMVPSFLTRHPDPEGRSPEIEIRRYGPPLAPPGRIKPAPEMSKDFFRNMRDLQNSMEDFSVLHDLANKHITPYTDFSDEALSSAVFLALFAVSALAFLGNDLVPWRAIFLAAGWTATLAVHPQAQKVLFTTDNLKSLHQHMDSLSTQVRNLVDTDILFDEPPEVRQVEIFELQKIHRDSNSWEGWLFTASPYEPLNPSRIAGARPKGTQFFEDVQPPSGWAWKDKKWSLDLWSREWVESRLVVGVEIETEGERWVYDVPMDVATRTGVQVKARPKSGWAEGTGTEERGEWRRRRWVRDVERKVVKTMPS